MPWHTLLDAHWLPCHLKFLRLPFQQSHWLLQHMAIYKSHFADFHFKKHVTSYMAILSKSLIILNNSCLILYHCILQ